MDEQSLFRSREPKHQSSGRARQAMIDLSGKRVIALCRLSVMKKVAQKCKFELHVSEKKSI